MPWGNYEVHGEPAGYLISAQCAEPGCTTEINKGVAYVCGDVGGGETGCGCYFCYAHLLIDDTGQHCRRCSDQVGSLKKVAP